MSNGTCDSDSAGRAGFGARVVTLLTAVLVWVRLLTLARIAPLSIVAAVYDRRLSRRKMHQRLNSGHQRLLVEWPESFLLCY